MKESSPEITEDRRHAALRMARAGLPASILRAALERFGCPLNAVSGSAGEWASLCASVSATVSKQTSFAFTIPESLPAQDTRWLQRPGAQVLAWSDACYPDALRGIENPPPLLFLEGDLDLLWRPQLAVVGSRQCSEAGRGHAQRFTNALAADGWLVSSGLARGIDAAAHEGAFSAGPTLAVTGCGLDVCYPTGHADLQHRIATQGLLVSEHPPGTPPLRAHFPSRNRILAGLALGCLVIEANLRSGALITARLAGEMGREVMALPGSLHNPHARGCHQLIKQGAHLVESAEDVTELMMPALHRQGLQLRATLLAASSPAAADESSPGIDPSAGKLLRLLRDAPLAPDALSARSGLTWTELSPMLMTMELSGLVTQQHGRYQLGRAAIPKERDE